MRFKVPLNELHTLLQKLMPAIPPKTTLPVLEHLHFSLKDNKLKAIATDQDITIITSLDVEAISEGAVLVPGRRFEQIIKLQEPSGTIDFSTDDDTYDITLLTGTGKYVLKGLSIDEYLDIPELFQAERLDFESIIEGNFKAGPKAILNKDETVYLASKTVFAVSHDEYRPAMTGVLFQFRQDHVITVATDSYRLVVAKSAKEDSVYPSELDVILPERAVELLKKIDRDVQLTLLETNGKITHARFDIDDTVFITKIIDEKFPPFETVIPKNNELILQVNQKELIKAINRVSIQTNTFSKHVKMKVSSENLLISGRDEDSGTVGDENIKCEFNGEEFETGFNYKFLLEAVQNLDLADDTVTITFSEPTRPVLIRASQTDDSLLMLIMPVRIP